MYHNALWSGCAAIVLLAGTAYGDATQIEVPAAADSYNYVHNQPHGYATYFPTFMDQENDRQAVSMIRFDLTGLGLTGSDIGGARIEFTVAAARNDYALDGPSGLFQAYERDAAFDEVEPNPAVSHLASPLIDVLRLVDDTSLLVLESDDLLADVRSWADDPAGNYGLDLTFSPVESELDTFWLALRSKDWGNQAQHPMLILTVPAPAPGVGGMLAAAVLLGSIRRRR